MQPCTHRTFHVDAQVIRLTESESPDSEITGYRVEIQIRCTECGEPFTWIAPAGFAPDHPATSADGLTLSAPIQPVSERGSLLAALETGLGRYTVAEG